MSSKKRPTRREFLLASSAVTIAAATPAVAQAQPASEPHAEPRSPYSAEELFHHGPQRTYSGDQTTQIALPIGGIGAGSFA